jgi:hypothetical protein
LSFLFAFVRVAVQAEHSVTMSRSLRSAAARLIAAMTYDVRWSAPSRGKPQQPNSGTSTRWNPSLSEMRRAEAS